MKAKRNIEAWEAAIIKQMLTGGTYTRDQIISFFSRPERPINGARITEISKGELFDEVDPATEQQVAAHIASFATPEDARGAFFEAAPLHPVSIAEILPLDEDTECLLIEETDRVECKEGLNFNSKPLYARLIASFANARGGLLVFGVRDEDKKVIGIKPGKLTSYDPAKLNQYLASIFSPAPDWKKVEHKIAGKTIGIIYVPRARSRPLVATKDDGDIREGDIYYRYPGETRRIKYAELAAIIQNQADQVTRYWADVLARIRRAGVENVAIFDTKSGEVSGRSGSFLIDEALLPKLKFIAEGHFNEKEGAPAVRLIGVVEPYGPEGAKGPVLIKHGLITDADLFSGFAARAVVEQPRLYLQRSAYSNRKWVPIFYYMRLAGLSVDKVVQLLEEQKDAKPHHVAELTKRLQDRAFPAGSPKPATAEPERSKVIAQKLKAPETEEECLRVAKAARALTVGELDPDFLLPILGACLEKFEGVKKATQAVQYALCHLDVVWQLQSEQKAEGALHAE